MNRMKHATRFSVAVGFVLVAAILLMIVGCGGDATTTSATSAQQSTTTAASSSAVASWLPPGFSGTPASGEPYIIGDVQGVSGWAAGGEVPSWDALKYVVDEYNKAGGILGHPIKLIQKDMQSDPALSAPATEELVDQGAQIIIAPAFPGECAGVIQTAAKYGIPVLSMNCSTPSATWVGGVLCPLVAFGDNAAGAAMAEYALKQGAKTAYVLGSPDSEYTEGLANYFGQAFEHGGGKVIGTDNFSMSQEDFATQVTKIAALDPQPDVIWKGVIIPYTGVFMKQLRAAGVTSLVVGNDGDYNQQNIDMGGQALEGMVCVAHGFPEPGSKNAVFQEGLTAFLGKPTDDPSLSSLAGDVMAVIKAAIDKAGTLDPEAVRAALPEVENVEGVNARITLKGTDGIPIKPVKVVAVEQGKFVLKAEFIPSWIPEPIGKAAATQ